jgi:hypothetical protein
LPSRSLQLENGPNDGTKLLPPSPANASFTSYGARQKKPRERCMNEALQRGPNVLLSGPFNKSF